MFENQNRFFVSFSLSLFFKRRFTFACANEKAVVFVFQIRFSVFEEPSLVTLLLFVRRSGAKKKNQPKRETEKLNDAQSPFVWT